MIELNHCTSCKEVSFPQD